MNDYLNRYLNETISLNSAQILERRVKIFLFETNKNVVIKIISILNVLPATTIGIADGERGQSIVRLKVRWVINLF